MSKSYPREGSLLPRSATGLALAAGLFAGSTAAQPLPAACPSGGPNYAPYGVSPFPVGGTGTPMLRVTLPGLSSRCNDGSQAVMYIRTPDAYYTGWGIPAAAQEHERWVIFFDGGGGCGDPDECLARWCGVSTFDRAGKMSTLGAYDAIPGARGVFRRDLAANAFAGYNQVLLNYCSSDNWVGSASLTGVVPSAGPTYDVEFNGEAIVNDAFAQLIAGGVAPDLGPAATFWNDALPSLLTAEQIVLMGESAGGGGLRHHLDRLHDMLLAAGLPAATRVVGVIDAANPPGLWDTASTPVTWGAAAGAPLSYADYLLTDAAARMGFWGVAPTALDQSCLAPGFAAGHVADGGVHPEICYDTTYTLFNHVTTPFFAREDVNDTLHRERYGLWALFPSLPAYWGATYTQLTTLAGWAGGLEPLAVTPGVFGPRCNEHVSSLNDHFFTRAVVSPGGAVGLSFHDLLVNWLNGAAPVSQVQADSLAGPPYSPSFCP